MLNLSCSGSHIGYLIYTSMKFCKGLSNDYSCTVVSIKFLVSQKNEAQVAQ
jgi:hypothetical protein